MSTTPASRTLFAAWIDDAAVFPPGNAPVPQAWSEHLALRAGEYADLLGPLLIGTSAAGELVDAAAAAPPPEHLTPVAVVPVARAGTPVEDLLAAVEALRASPALQVPGAEIAHDGSDAWRRLLDHDLRVAVEVPREGAQMVAALDDLAGAAADLDTAAEDATPPARVVAKLRTQATADQPAPTARQLAEFLTAAKERGLPVKLTGGLHRAVAHPGEAEPHGALTLLVAAHYLVDGAGLQSLASTLELADGAALASLASGLGEDDTRAVREAFVSFGCCGVLDPIHDLVGLGLLPEADPNAQPHGDAHDDAGGDTAPHTAPQTEKESS